jgi:hypothetical protein
MLSRSLRSTTQVLGILALGVLTACGGGAGTPSTPAGASVQAVRSAQQETLSSASALAGTWTGTLTQENDSLTYTISLDAKADGDTLSGTSRIQEGAHYAVMSFVATVTRETVQYAEKEILEQSVLDQLIPTPLLRECVLG